MRKLALMVLWLCSCGEDASREQAYAWDLPAGFPEPRVPERNPMSAAKAELGRHLFYDERLSRNGAQSCGTCHLQQRAFTEARETSVGTTGEAHPRNALTLTNSAYSGSLTWANPRLVEFEAQILVPMFGEAPVELGMTGYEEEIMTRLRAEPRYDALFADAFPTQSTFEWPAVRDALACFVRTLVSGHSPYDSYRQGDTLAISDAAKRGRALFFSERLECYHCHGGFNFTISVRAQDTAATAFHNNGLYDLDGAGAYPPDNTGLMELTGEPTDMGRFRPPTLRNVALTAPYMHDGSMATLDDVLRAYERGGRLIETGPHAGDGAQSPLKSGLLIGFTLTDEERGDVIAFLESLTDVEFVTDPTFSDPWR